MNVSNGVYTSFRKTFLLFHTAFLKCFVCSRVGTLDSILGILGATILLCLQRIRSRWFLFFDRSSRPEVFCKNTVLRNFAKFKGKHLCQSIFFNNFFTEHLRWLLLIRSGKSFHPLQFIYSLPQKNHAYLNLVYSICHRVNIYRLVKLLVSSPPSTTTLRFIDSSSMDISLGKSTKFPIPSSSSSTVKTLSEGLTSSSMKIWFSLDNIWASHDLRKTFPTFYLMSYTYLLFQLCRKICKQIIWHLFSISQIITRWLVN